MTQGEFRAVENILTASYDGWHLALVDAARISALANSIALGSTARTELARCAAEFSERQSLFTLVEMSVSAVQGIGDIRARQDGFEVPLAFFENPTDVRKMPFIAENLRDIRLLAPEIDAFFESEFGGFVEARFQGVGTGGPNYQQTFDEQLIDCRVGLLLVLFDSDKWCPNCAEGNTAREARGALQEVLNRGFQLVFSHCLDASEIENIVPTEYWNMLPRQRRNRYRRSEQNIHRAMMADGDVWKYVDWKNGTKWVKLEGRQCCNSYWRDIAERHIPNFRRDCIANGCQRNMETCICFFTEKMGPNSMRDIVRSDQFNRLCAKPRSAVERIPARGDARSSLIEKLVPILIGARSRVA